MIAAIDFNLNTQCSITSGKPQLCVERKLLIKIQLHLKSGISKHLFLTKHRPLLFIKACSITSKDKNELGHKSVTEHMQSVELVDVLQDSCNTIKSLLYIKHSFNSKLSKLGGKYYKFVEVQ